MQGLEYSCHFITLNAKGETIDSLMRQGDTDKLERVLMEWINKTLARLQSDKATEKAKKEKGMIRL